MARWHLESILSGDEQDLSEVWEWYDFQGALIGEERARTFDALLAGATLSRPLYFGKTRDELTELFERQIKELEQVTMLGLLAAAEAALRVDYIVRVIHNRKDRVSRQFAALYKKRKLEVGLEKQLLEVWKRHSMHPSVKQAVGEFKGALKLRHWLAHGRYWERQLGREYDPQDVFAICDELLNATAVR